jgi:hypothetical protein
MPAPSLAAIKSHELTAGGLAVHLDCICRGKLTNIGGERGDGELGMGRGRGNSDQDFPRAGVFAKRNGNKDNKRTTPKREITTALNQTKTGQAARKPHPLNRGKDLRWLDKQGLWSEPCSTQPGPTLQPAQQAESHQKRSRNCAQD